MPADNNNNPPSDPPVEAATPQRTPEERFERARTYIREMGYETFADVLLLTAIGSPMILISAMQEAGARVIQVSEEAANALDPHVPTKKETVN